MKEVKPPKKPLLFYYGIVLAVIFAFNLLVYPMLLKAQVKEVDYGTFMKAIEEQKIDRVQVEDTQIVFTEKEDDAIYKTGVMDDRAAVSGRGNFCKRYRPDHFAGVELCSYRDCADPDFYGIGTVYEQKADGTGGRKECDVFWYGKEQCQSICAVN